MNGLQSHVGSHYFHWEQLVSYFLFSPQAALPGNGALHGAELLAKWYSSPPFCVEYNSDNYPSSLDFILWTFKMFSISERIRGKSANVRMEAAHLMSQEQYIGMTICCDSSTEFIFKVSYNFTWMFAFKQFFRKSWGHLMTPLCMIYKLNNIEILFTV